MHQQHADWPQDALAKIKPLIPDYRGTVEPMQQNRTPDERLRWPDAVVAG